MEARSLASINYLAANPPQYPVNPAETQQEPLTLYISRVPGTRGRSPSRHAALPSLVVVKLVQSQLTQPCLDVILSPFKPQLKNVTVEDVASSLYYVHLDTTVPSDGPEGPPHRRGRGRPDGSSDEGSPSRKAAIPRKPIPGNGAAVHDPVTVGRQQNVPPPRHSVDNPHHHASPTHLTAHHAWRPMEDSGISFNEAPQLPPHLPVSPLMQGPASSPFMPVPASPHIQAPQPAFPARKPVAGPRLMNNTVVPPPISTRNRDSLSPAPREPFTSNERGYGFEYTSSRPSTGRASYIEFQEARGAGHPAEPPVGHRTSVLYPDDSSRLATQAYETDVQSPTGRFSPNRFTRSPSPTPTKQKDLFTLHLIRRDPSSGNQWNVGRISSQQIDGQSSAFENGTHSPIRALSSSSARPAIDIQLETLGYAKFRHMPNRRSVDVTGPHMTAAALSAAAHGENMLPHSEGGAAFTRQVQMAYSKSWTSNLKEKWNRMEQNHKASRQGHGRSHSAVSATPSMVSLGNTSPPYPTVGHPGPGMKPRGYVFTSPWDGRCDFRTGNAGRSLRCHHALHNGQTSSYNPLVAEQEGGNGLIPSGSPSSVVSELRFNLPSSELLAPDDQNRRGAAHQRLGSLSKFWKRGDDQDSDDYDDGHEISPFDVNLGKERAGGGNRGSRAKLGKLIVYGDGLKMLDLVVSANIGVWWGSWERSF